MTIKYPELLVYKGKSGIYKISISKKTYIGSAVNLHRRLYVHMNSMIKGKHENQHLQRSYNKYGRCKIEIIEECSKEELLKREKFYIDKLKPNLNQKLDPITQNNCKSTSKVVYQFDLRGNLIKEWPSAAEAGRILGFDPSSITVAILRPLRQRIAGGWLWSRDKICKTTKLIRVYQESKYIGEYVSTIEIFEKFFNNGASTKKTALSKIKEHLDKDKPYKNYYFKPIN